MVKKARSKRIRNSAFLVADAHRLPFETGSFDIAVAITTLEFLREPERTVREMVRCVRSPGILLFGILNARARFNRRRREAGDSVLRSAAFMSPNRVSAMLAPYRDVKVITAGFVPPFARLVPLVAV